MARRSFLTRSLAGAAALAISATLGACGGEGGNPLTEGGGGDGIVVGSANFPESVLLAEIYAQALEATGADVERTYNIGSREIYFGQVERGAITLMPEYNGALLAYLGTGATARTTEDINAALAEALSDGLEILDSAPAQNTDALVVTEDTAQRFDLATIADLAPVAGDMRVGAAPEFQTREQGLVGLEETYGVVFEEFVATDNSGPLTISALARGDIDVANIYSTDPALSSRPFVVLEDTESVFGAQNITPLVSSGVLGDEAVARANEVSARLTTDTLAGLLASVITERRDVNEVAAEWLAEQGLA
ncbi:ABC transporter substrate-binding protein [Lolliginicoccus suaedae]|uniref:ABC transporter substrate-binding protein n=1 Tax=Lolliginicoccus suaedae TaxID=2605429 RepID=UPI001F3C7CB3|nr:ABC transporter substrate-binding protein [Lolliginicoccus suaedae]